jgi:tetratricopeptide (TPR) repeat protein
MSKREDDWDDDWVDDEEEWAARITTMAEHILAERGIVADYDELARLVDEALDEPDLEGEAMTELLVDSEGVYDLLDGRVADLARLVEGLTVTRRLSRDEAAVERITFALDLLPLSYISVESFPLTGGGTAEVSDPPLPNEIGDADLPSFGEAEAPAPLDDDMRSCDDWLLTGPPGWLRAAAGDLVSLTWRDGALHVAVAVADPASTERATAALRRAAEVHVAGDDAVDAGNLILQVMAEDRELFRTPLQPLSELVAAAGLEAHGDWVARPGFDWSAWRTRHAQRTFEGHLRVAHGLDDFGVDAAKAVLGGYHAFTERSAVFDPTWREPLLAALCHPGVAEAVADLALGGDGAAAGELAAFAEALLGAEADHWGAGSHFLLARCAEFAGDARAGEEHLLAALEADPDFEPALLDAAWYAEDRGDALTALQRLRRAEVDDEELLALLERYARPGPGSARRNDPCPCGSGRKYKVCCLPRRGWPLSARLPWLLGKLVAFCHRPPQRPRLLEIAEARAVDAHGAQALHHALGDPLVSDLALFEGGLLERYLAARGELLPADELALAHSWVGAPRRLCKVTQVHRDEGLVLLDLRSGERLAVSERLATHDLEVGESVFARIVGDGAGLQLIGGVHRVTVAQRPALLALLDADPGPEQIAAWFAAAEAPPTMRNMEHEPVVLCTATYRLADPAGAAPALAARFQPADDGTFHESVEVDGQTWIRGTLRLDGDRLVVEANSDTRINRLRRAVEESIAGAELLSDTREPFDAAAAMAQAMTAGGPPIGEDAELPSELLDELERRVASYEAAWVDLPVPLFGGLTPREAVADPTRRGDVEQFLAEAERDGSAATGPWRGMDPRRLRALLGLDS